MKIVIAGGTGFIGRQVSQFLIHSGHSVTLLSRHTPADKHLVNIHARHIQWAGCAQEAWAQECEGADVVINLSGAPIADSRWTKKRKQELIESRVQSTKALLQAVSSWKNKPHTFMTASGIGFYGDRGEEVVNESSTPGEGFLRELCQAWEGAAMEGEALGLRVIPIRIGMVLGPDGGALSKMTLPFRLFLGGPILPGTQFVSWIHREDLARLILFLITHSTIRGPVNAVAPEPVTMQDFCTALGKAMNRPSWFPVPEFVLRMTLGELATMLTTGQRVHPLKALEAGFSYSYATLQPALDSLFAAPLTKRRSLK
jgi:uncharacterized protein (TIGR01777 family)